MMRRFVRRVRDVVGPKQTYLIHLITFNRKSLDDSLGLLSECDVVSQSTNTRNFHLTLKITTRLPQLRHLIDALPHDVAVAYEELQV